MGANRRPAGPLACVVGARPELHEDGAAARARSRATPALPRAVLVHTGQHYDVAMNDRLFADLELPAPDLNLEVGSGTHAVQTAEVMRRFEPVLDAATSRRAWSSSATSTRRSPCSLVAVEEGRAGRRTSRRACAASTARCPKRSTASSPTRSRTSSTRPSASAADEPRARRHRRRAHRVRRQRDDRLAAARNWPRAVAAGGDAAARRASTARSRERARASASSRCIGRRTSTSRDALRECARRSCATSSARLPLIWPLHPRTRAQHRALRPGRAARDPRIAVLPPQGYLEMLGLMAEATLVLTDSGGMQEETTALGVPCLTMRENTERPITVDEGTNTLVGRDARARRCGWSTRSCRRRQARARAGAVGRPRRGAHRRASRAPGSPRGTRAERR